MSRFTRRGFLQGTLAGTAGVAALGSTPLPARASSSPSRALVVVQTTVNGKAQAVTVGPDEALVHTVRDRLGLTGTKLSCGAGTCGACTVLLEDAPVCACLLPTTAVEGRKVTTVEGLPVGGRLHPVQRAFMAEDALQCGFCTPGFMMTTLELLRENPDPSDEQIKEALGGNLCRCTGYQSIMDSVRLAAQRMKSSTLG